MEFLRMTGLALVAGVGLNAAAAHAAQASPPPAAGAAAASAAAIDDRADLELRDHHRHNYSGGVTMFVAMSLDTLGEDDAKRTQIEKLQRDLNAEMTPARDATKNLLLTLADGVDAGAVDKAKVDAILATLATAADAEHQASLETLNKLHAILSPPERAALADKVEAHWDVWRQVNHGEQLGKRERGGRLARLTEELSLTPDQASGISTAYHTGLAGLRVEFDPKRGEAHVHAFSRTFAATSFDAKSVTPNASAHLAGYGAARMALFYETVASVLTPEQRTKLAEQLRERGSHESATSRT